MEDSLKARTSIGLLFGVAMLTACSDAPAPKLSKEEEQVLDAMMFLFSGLEDNTKDDYGLTPWKREAKGRNVEFTKIGENGISSSDEEENRKLRQSKYIRYLRRITIEEPCVFHFEEINEFSKGDSTEDFSFHSFKNSLNTHIFNLGNAHKFVLNFEHEYSSRPVIEIEGPRVVCEEYGYCENEWDSSISGMSGSRFQGTEAENSRRLRALEFIKKMCPGKPY